MQSSIVTASKTRGRTPRKPQRPELALHSLATPAFGKADLSNCEREEIHLAGSIQPHGALLVVSEPDHRVIQASANAAEFLNLKQVIGMALADLDGDLLVRILPHLDPTSQGMPIAVRCRIGSPSAEFDGCCIGRPPVVWSSNWSAPGRRSICPGRSRTRLRRSARHPRFARCAKKRRRCFRIAPATTA